MSLLLLGLAAHEPLRALVAEQLAVVVELDDVRGEQIRGARDALELEDVDRHEPGLAVPLQAAHRLGRVAGQVLDRLARGDGEVSRGEPAVAAVIARRFRHGFYLPAMHAQQSGAGPAPP